MLFSTSRLALFLPLLLLPVVMAFPFVARALADDVQSYVIVFTPKISESAVTAYYATLEDALGKTNAMRTASSPPATPLAIKHRYNMVGFKGFSADLDASTVDAIRADTSNILTVEADQEMHANLNDPIFNAREHFREL